MKIVMNFFLKRRYFPLVGRIFVDYTAVVVTAITESHSLVYALTPNRTRIPMVRFSGILNCKLFVVN